MGNTSPNNKNKTNTESADKIFNDTINKRGLEIIKDAENLDNGIKILRNAFHKMTSNDAVISGVLSNEFATVDELNYASAYNKKRAAFGTYGTYEYDYDEETGEKIESSKRFTGEGLLGNFHQLKENLDKLISAYNDENLSYEERILLIQKIDETYEEYTDTVEKLSKVCQN